MAENYMTKIKEIFKIKKVIIEIRDTLRPKKMDSNFTIKANPAWPVYATNIALQKSLFFYEVKQPGVLHDWNKIFQDSIEKDKIPGGWFDSDDQF